MLTRRRFAGFASGAICAVSGFIARKASAQGAPAATTPGVTRKILSQTDGPTPGYTTILVEAIIEAGVPVARHTHPGVESAYVLEGGFELPIKVRRPAPSNQAMVFKYRPITRMREASPATPRPEF
jgi:hypothetical protein